METIIEIKNLTVVYHEKPVLWNINLKLAKDEMIAIVGPNGAGKSTLLKTMLGLVKPISGSINFNISEPLKNKIGYVPQSESVDWDFPVTVIDVVIMGIYGHLGWFKRPKKKDYEKAYQILDKVGMKDYASRQISELSGGQQQRVFLARAIIQNAEVYFLDEPFKGIDSKTQKIVFTILKELKKMKKTIIVVHHDLATIENNFDSIVFINKKIKDSGPVKAKFNQKNIADTYYESSEEES